LHEVEGAGIVLKFGKEDKAVL